MAQLVIANSELIQDLTEIAQRQERAVEDVVEDVLREFADSQKTEQSDENPLRVFAETFWSLNVELSDEVSARDSRRILEEDLGTDLWQRLKDRDGTD